MLNGAFGEGASLLIRTTVDGEVDEYDDVAFAGEYYTAAFPIELGMPFELSIMLQATAEVLQDPTIAADRTTDFLTGDYGLVVVDATITQGGEAVRALIRGTQYVYAGCIADCDVSGELDFFDFLCFQDEFSAGSPFADCDGDGELTFFDFLCFQNAFVAGCE